MHRSAIMTAVKPTKEAKAAGSLAELEAELATWRKEEKLHIKALDKAVKAITRLEAKIAKLSS